MSGQFSLQWLPVPARLLGQIKSRKLWLSMPIALIFNPLEARAVVSSQLMWMYSTCSEHGDFPRFLDDLKRHLSRVFVFQRRVDCRLGPFIRAVHHPSLKLYTVVVRRVRYAQLLHKYLCRSYVDHLQDVLLYCLTRMTPS